MWEKGETDGMSGLFQQLRSRYQSRREPVYSILRPFVSARNALGRLAPHHRAEVWICWGRERHSGLEMAYTYSGNREQRAYLRRIVFGGGADDHCVSPWEVAGPPCFQAACERRHQPRVRATARHDVGDGDSERRPE